jgi:hypothetical protein
MKLTRLDSSTARLASEAVQRAHESAADQVRRVEAMEGVEGDRQRSLRQELAEIDQRAVGPFEGQDQVIRDAREIAGRLASLESPASIVRGSAIPVSLQEHVDAKV